MKFEFVDEAKRFYALYSIWFFALLGSLGDIYNLAVQNNLLTGDAAPALMVHSLNLIAFVGGVSRLVKQKEAVLEAEKAAEPPAA